MDEMEGPAPPAVEVYGMVGFGEMGGRLIGGFGFGDSSLVRTDLPFLEFGFGFGLFDAMMI